MTAPMRNAPHASALPASQTAPVAEFRCLFTHDVRRKQKRWQDGYLKFHTFNNRVMVSDQARNHIGDTYWKESNELQEGDELSLDKGVLVEVAEAVGITQTDLAPLFEKRTKEPAKEPAATRAPPSVATKPFQRPSTVASSNVTRTATQLRHKSLNTLLGTPKGPVGKAQPMKSPYEARIEQEKENDLTEERAPKRQKVAQRHGGWRASSPVQGEESPPAKTTPLWARTADAKNIRTSQARMPPVSKIIDISSETDHIAVLSSEVTLPSTPAKAIKQVARPPVTSPSVVQSSIFDEPEPVETAKPPPAKVRLPKSRTVETPKRPAPHSSPPVSASNRLTNVDFAVQPVQNPAKEPPSKASSPPIPKAKLRLSTGAKRGTLLCKSLPPPGSRAAREARASDSQLNATSASRMVSKEPSPAVHDSGKVIPRAELLPRLKTSPPFKDTRKLSNAKNKDARRATKKSLPADESVEDVFDDPELIHGLMDQQLLVPSSPVEPLQTRMSPPPKVASSKPLVAISTSNKRTKASKAPEMEEPTAESVEPSVAELASKKAATAKRITEKPRTSRPISPPAEPIFEPPAPPLRENSHGNTDTSVLPSCPSSKSPTKSLLSTGGFRKKAKRTSKGSPAQSIPNEPPRNVSVSLPKGPLISTTELASLLQKRKVRDPIEESSQTTRKSPARKIRRVRSENDAPIPSTAEDWEKRNLPKTDSSLTDVGGGEEVQEPVIKKKVSALAALVKRTDPRKRFARAKSLSVDTGGGMGEGVGIDLPSPVIDKDVGPWSTEAGDLFDWRPPNREEGPDNVESGFG